METVLAGLPFAKCYVDDILICSPDVDTHLSHLDIVLSRLHDANMKIKAKKCHFGLSEIKYLGHIVAQEGVKPDPENVAVAAIKDMNQRDRGPGFLRDNRILPEIHKRLCNNSKAPHRFNTQRRGQRSGELDARVHSRL